MLNKDTHSLSIPPGDQMHLRHDVMISIMRCRGLGPPHMRWGVLEVMYRDNDCGHLLEQWVEIPLDELVRTAHMR